ncbi:hypothetical protein C8R42DRAFT_667792 [Lentinula raphanica]|nr:hypothetical protein C8R42DRAFT_667792 [Lentinula raphanica]
MTPWSNILLLAILAVLCSSSPVPFQQDTEEIVTNSNHIVPRDTPEAKKIVFGYFYTIPNTAPGEHGSQKRVDISSQPRTFSAPLSLNSGQAVELPANIPLSSHFAKRQLHEEEGLKAVKRLEALMNTGDYNSYFIGPNFFNMYAPQTYSQAKSVVDKEKVNRLQFAYLPLKVEAEAAAVEDHVAWFLGEDPPSLVQTEKKRAKIRDELSNVIIIAELGVQRFAFLVPKAVHADLKVTSTTDNHDMPAADWKNWKNIKKLRKRIPDLTPPISRIWGMPY